MTIWNYLYLSPDWFGFWLSLGIGLLVVFVIDFFIFPKFVYPLKRLNLFMIFLRYFLSLLVVFLVALTFLNIWWIKSTLIKVEKTLNIQVLMDVSLSMAATDIPPSRFQVAKNSLADFLRQLPGYNVSVIMFSWMPIMWVPFTDETEAAASKLQDTNLAMFPPIMDFVWTAIGNALLLWIENLLNFATNKQKPGVIILLTDGDSNRWYDPVQVAQYAKTLGIKIYLLAIWKDSYKIALRRDWSYEYTRINLDKLKKITQANGWNFYHILSSGDFQQVLQDIKKEIKTQEKKKVQYVTVNLNKYIYLLLAVVLFLNIIFRFIYWRS